MTNPNPAAPLTEAEVERYRQNHQPRDSWRPTACGACRESWPCGGARIVATLDAARATSTPAGLDDDYAHHEFRQGGYLTVPLPNDECVWRVDHGPYCGATRADHDNTLAKRRAGTWRWSVPLSKEPTDD